MSDPLLSEMLKMAEFESHLIVLDDWHAKVTILVGGTYDQHIDEFRKRRVSVPERKILADYCRDEMSDSLAVVLQPESRKGVQFVYLPSRPNLDNPEHVWTVVHEVFHVTVAIMRRAQVRLTDASEEAFAYLHAHLVREFWKKLKGK